MLTRARMTTILGAAIALIAAVSAQAAGPIGPIAQPPSNVSLPTISGTPSRGQTLSSSAGSWDGIPAPTLTRQWRKCTPVEPALPIDINVAGSSPGQIAVAPNGDAYVAAGQVWRIPAGGGAPTAIPGTIDAGRDVAVDRWGNVYAINAAAESVIKISATDDSVTTFGATGNNPSAIAVDRGGVVYVANYDDMTVSRLYGGSTPADQVIAVPHGDHPALTELAIDSANNVFVVNPREQSIAKIDTSGSATIFAAWIGDRPQSIATDWSGNVFVAGENGLVKKFSSGGAELPLASAPGDHYGIAVDRNGDVWLGDRLGSSLSLLPADGSAAIGVTSIGSAPVGIALDTSGNVFVANSTGGGSGKSVTKLSRNNCADAGLFTGSSYDLAGVDVGKRIQLRVTGSNAWGPETAFSALTEIVTSAPFISDSGDVALAGLQSVGNTLSRVGATWSGYPSPTITANWLRCDAALVSCTTVGTPDSSNYSLVHADAGMRIVVEETGVNSVGTVTERLLTSDLITEVPANTALPTLSGNAALGSTLTSDAGQWVGFPDPAIALQWQRCDAAGANCSDIAGATSASYAATVDDLGSTLRIAATATNSAGSATALSGASAVVAAPPAPGSPGGGSAGSTPAQFELAIKAPKSVKSGRTFKLSITARNSGAIAASPIKTCLALPRAVHVTSRGKSKPKLTKRSACWTRAALAARATARYSLKLKTTAKRGKLRFSVKLTAGAVSVKAKGTSHIKRG